jgi:hypothetical protein
MTSREGGDTEGSPREVLPPGPATTLAEFTPALRQLRTWAGLTYRQLEARARELGKTLPSSTIATTLGRNTLPRESFVDTYTRACGLDDEQVRRWLDARARIAMGTEPQTDEAIVAGRIDNGAEMATAPTRIHASWHWRAPLVVIMVVGIGLVAALGLRALPFGTPAQNTSTTPTTSTGASFTMSTVPGLNIPEVGTWAEIHPARTPQFCLGEGRDRTRLYPTAIAAQQPCNQAESPRVFVDPVGGDNAVQIQWHHSETGVGCLTVLNEGVGQDLLVPRDDCDDDNSDQMFTLEPISSPDPEKKRFRIRPLNADNRCLGLRDQDTIAGTEIVQERCSGAADQEFIINDVPPP